VLGLEVVYPPSPNGPEEDHKQPFSAATLDKLVEIITSQLGDYVGKLFLLRFCCTSSHLIHDTRSKPTESLHRNLSLIHYTR